MTRFGKGKTDSGDIEQADFADISMKANQKTDKKLIGKANKKKNLGKQTRDDED